jgi:hypothetical protein
MEKVETTKAVKETKAEKTIMIVVPIDEKDPANFVPVCINGKITQVMRGTEVEVPMEVYNILKRSGYLGIKVK